MTTEATDASALAKLAGEQSETTFASSPLSLSAQVDGNETIAAPCRNMAKAPQ
ncbi:hypothetical protein [Verrucomicrobium spinosum]|uniref:hypothetical protein n=1 Tax=Verrucomicrobium spinosum TaxID=2736 RepID=UPI001C45FDFC|nr:hypothetical protein [Verrucomicrobium spinosum]